jgi:A/G-specific adenine glycosylase
MNKAQEISQKLMEWYGENKRILPFRDIDNPYFTWVSEIMLQQTQVDTAIPYFNRFIKRFETPCDLANASSDEVLKYWEGLGYYRRAHHLHETAKIICEDHKGVFPSDLATIESFKGIGRYIARAIHSIAFNQPSPAVDGNVIRVMSRLLAYDKDLTKPANQKEIEQAVEAMIQHQTPRDFTQALMEIGAMVCQKQPKCEMCPLKEDCKAYQSNTQSSYPNLPKKTKITNHNFHVFVIGDHQKAFLIKRPPNGLLANLYTFPQFEMPLEDALLLFEKTYDVKVASHQSLFELNHVFSHQTWHLTVHQLTLKKGQSLALEALSDFPYAIAKAHLNIIDRLLK